VNQAAGRQQQDKQNDDNFFKKIIAIADIYVILELVREKIMTWVHLTNISGNRKVGPIKVTTTEKSSCPSECGIADECYAGGGPLNIHWNQVSQQKRIVAT
jgi:hypothetical protein